MAQHPPRLSSAESPAAITSHSTTVDSSTATKCRTPAVKSSTRNNSPWTTSSAPAHAHTHGSGRKANSCSSHLLTGTPKTPAGMWHPATNPMTPDASAAVLPTIASAAMPAAQTWRSTQLSTCSQICPIASETPPFTKFKLAANAATVPDSITLTDTDSEPPHKLRPPATLP